MKTLVLVTTLVLSSIGAVAGPIAHTDLATWLASTDAPYGVETYDGGVSGLLTTGSAVEGVGGGDLRVWLHGSDTVEFSLIDGGLFSAFILKLDTTRASNGSGVVLGVDGVNLIEVGTAGVYDGWLGFTTDSPVALVSLSTHYWSNYLPGEHLDVAVVKWKEEEMVSSVPEPGTGWMLVSVLGWAAGGARPGAGRPPKKK